jgi:hypothetical protein
MAQQSAEREKEGEDTKFTFWSSFDIILVISRREIHDHNG